MCSVGDSFSIDLAEGITSRNYKCKGCGKQFKGIGTNPKCPECDSANTETL
jgi:rubrerythrin